jgi:hypothetical protein
LTAYIAPWKPVRFPIVMLPPDTKASRFCCGFQSASHSGSPHTVVWFAKVMSPAA